MDIVIVTLLLTGMFVVLIKQWAPPDLTMFVTLSVFLLTGVITPEEAFRGFANTSVITIALLFIIGYSVFKSGILISLLQQCLNREDKQPVLLLKIMSPVAILSGIMNNTPIVSMLTPSITNWAGNNQVPPSKLLIPLSYAAILGGSITLYGSSTNLIIHGLLIEEGHPGFTVFEFSLIGIPLTLLGVVYVSLIGSLLLPDRTPGNQRQKAQSEVPLTKCQTGIVFLVITIMIGSVAFHLTSLVKAALAGVIILLVTKVIRPSEARKAVNGNVLLLMASAIGIGTAIEKSGITKLLTTAFMDLYPFIGLAGVILLLYLATMILTEISHNIAAAVLMFPIGQSMADLVEADPKMFAIVIAISASCSFITPIGYQTNVIIFEPGGYRFKDFIRAGIGLSILCAVCTVGLALFIWG
ncbi:SLC13 family permease [Halobacillus sp. Marseille-P3879]|uniref:SLC13 family permease n=1 Tax=Halobacillus sp. Marseille-P3879 TaxID=2045014 RepID=UPI000C7A5D02|nr:SLC13 family permease [Halobacillus sp. Marseille-P3879]